MSLRNARLTWALRALIAAAAVGCICLGALRGETEIVLRKAVRISLECIGVGA